MSDPVRNAKRAELGEIAVIEDQDEMRRLVAETLEHMGVAARKVPNVARCKIIRFSLTRWVNHCRTNAAFEDECPLGCSRVPVKLAHYAGLELHRHTSDSFRDRQLLDRRVLARAVPDHLSLGFLQFELKAGQFFPGQQRVGNITLKTEIAAFHRSWPLQKLLAAIAMVPINLRRVKSLIL